MVHVSGGKGGKPAAIGNNVYIGTGCIIHGCVLEDGCYIGEGAQVLDDAVVQKGAIVAPGAIVTKGKVVAAGQYWAGAPAKFVREVGVQERLKYVATLKEYSELSTLYLKETSKTRDEIEEDEFLYYEDQFRDPTYPKRVTLEVSFAFTSTCNR